MADPPWDHLWCGVHLATMTDAEMGRIPQGAIATRGERIAWVGAEAELPGPPPSLARRVHDGRGAWLLPGLIDCHTHLVFGGDRCHEFRQRLHGATYEEIARAGGGIRATVTATRGSSEEALLESALGRARDLADWGVTTLEVKSGYGLDLETELRMLRVAAALGGPLDVDVHPTLLAAHAVPLEFVGRADEYVTFVVEEVLPAAVSEGVVRGVDVFCEDIAFNRSQARRVLAAGVEKGLVGRIHADQLTDGGGGALAAEVGAHSADHLEFLSEAGVDAMARAGVVAGLLPGAFYSLRQTRRPPVSMLRAAGVPMAVATDANPGSSPISHLGVVLNMACVLFRLTPEEALLGVTRCAAAALDLSADRGTLAPGLRADFSLWNVPDPAWLPYWIGSPPLAGRVRNGRPAGGV
ncbi:MAG: imidazolonepropionase [Gemmatimonadota bacterium]|nr:imidazolonepropionase [Gemmatimonadota bacterium]